MLYGEDGVVGGGGGGSGRSGGIDEGRSGDGEKGLLSDRALRRKVLLRSDHVAVWIMAVALISSLVEGAMGIGEDLGGGGERGGMAGGGNWETGNVENGGWGRRQTSNCAQQQGDVSVPCAFYSSGAGNGPGDFAWGGRGWQGGWLGVSTAGSMQAKPRIKSFDKTLSPGMKYNSPVVSQSGWHLVTHTGLLYTIDFFGEISWLLVVESGVTVESSPTLYGNMLVIPSSTGLIAFDMRENVPTNLRKLWKVEIPGGVYSTPTVTAGDDGKVNVFATADDQK